MIANDKPASTRTAADVMVASFLTCKFACRGLARRHRWDIRHRRRRTHHASLGPRARRSPGMAAADARVPSLSQDFPKLMLIAPNRGPPRRRLRARACGFESAGRSDSGEGSVHGEKPTSIDAGIYGFIANIYFYDIDTPLKRFVVAHDNIVRHCLAIHRAVSEPDS